MKKYDGTSKAKWKNVSLAADTLRKSIKTLISGNLVYKKTASERMPRATQQKTVTTGQQSYT